MKCDRIYLSTNYSANFYADFEAQIVETIS